MRYSTPQANTKVQIEYADQGIGRVICILPSLARSGLDYDIVASYLQQDGFRVIRPIHAALDKAKAQCMSSCMHDFAADVAAVLDQERTGPIVIVGHA